MRLADLTTSDWITIGEGTLSVIGFAATFIQFKRVKQAASEQAARSAVDMLLLRIGGLERVHDALLRRATDASPSHELVGEAIRDWGVLVVEIQALLGVGDEHDEKFRSSLTISLAKARVAMQNVHARVTPLAPDLQALLATTETVCLEGRHLATAKTVTPRP